MHILLVILEINNDIIKVCKNAEIQDWKHGFHEHIFDIRWLCNSESETRTTSSILKKVFKLSTLQGNLLNMTWNIILWKRMIKSTFNWYIMVLGRKNRIFVIGTCSSISKIKTDPMTSYFISDYYRLVQIVIFSLVEFFS